MDKSQAEALTAKLAAAFPRDWVGEATFAVYAERLQLLPYFAAGVDAVDALIDTETRLPTVAVVRDEYRRHHDKHLPPQLPEPELTPEQRAENIRRMRELTQNIGRPVEDAA